MELKDAILNRKSIRGFHNTPIKKDILEQVLQLATRAVSGVNSQPWEFVVATGSILDTLRERNIESLRSGAPEDRTYMGVPAGIYMERSKTIGKALLGAMHIAREDKAQRIWWSERGFRFFDAPAIIFLLMDQQLDETSFRFDMGCVAQNICLAAMEFGLGTCVEDQAITYQKAARELLQIPENKRFAAAIAIGYPDDAFAANHVVSPREDINAITMWHGFDTPV